MKVDLNFFILTTIYACKDILTSLILLAYITNHVRHNCRLRTLTVLAINHDPEYVGVKWVQFLSNLSYVNLQINSMI